MQDFEYLYATAVLLVLFFSERCEFFFHRCKCASLAAAVMMEKQRRFQFVQSSLCPSCQSRNKTHTLVVFTLQPHSILVLDAYIYLDPQQTHLSGQIHRTHFHSPRNERHLRSVMESTRLICHLVGAPQAAAKQPLIRLPWKEHWFGACEAEI